MSTTEDTIGIARDHRWMRLPVQKARLGEVSRRVLVLGDSAGRNGRGYRLADVAPIIRPGTVVQVMYAFLLADSKVETTRLRRAAFNQALAIVERREGIVRDMLTGLSTETKEKRRAFIDSAYGQIKRSNQGLNSEENGNRSRGRPSRWADPERRKIIWAEWHNNAHATNTDAADEASRQMGIRIGHYVMWKVVKEMREAQGLKGNGASGRRPNSATATLAATVGVPSGRPPVPKKIIPKGVVYFIKNGAQGRVKIGFSGNHKMRLSTLQVSTPDKLTLLGFLPGTLRTEDRYQQRFDKYKVIGEWFRIEGELAKFLKATFPKSMAEK